MPVRNRLVIRPARVSNGWQKPMNKAARCEGTRGFFRQPVENEFVRSTDGVLVGSKLLFTYGPTATKRRELLETSVGLPTATATLVAGAVAV